MEWVDTLPQRLQDAIWYGTLIGAVLVVFAIGYRRALPLLKMPSSNGSSGYLARMKDDPRDILDKMDDMIGGSRQVCASVDALGRVITAGIEMHSRRESEELERIGRLLEELIRKS